MRQAPITVLNFYQKKQINEKITLVTCYDYTSARILSQTAVDCLLVGDSLAMTMHGFEDTLSASTEMMCLHTAAVSRGAGHLFVVSDMPFLSYRKSLKHTMTTAQQLMQSGAHALKLEGAAGNLKPIRHLVESGVPIMGHLGLTPQFRHQLGGYRVQGKTTESADRIKEEALFLQEAGCFALVLECIPALLAEEITSNLSIPTIGIGSGAKTDGQVLVFQDMLGLNIDFKPKFVKQYLDGHQQLVQSINQYVNETKSGVFPSHEYSY